MAKRPPRQGRVLPPVAEEDAALFRSAVGDAIPLAPDGRIPPSRPHVSPRPRARGAAYAAREDGLSDGLDLALDPGEALSWLRPGMDSQALRRLRRGHWPVGAELDLHGLTGDEARGALAAFLDGCRGRDVRCARVIHGKGLRSPDGTPVLKARVKHWLVQRGDVLAFCQAPASQGGGGAVLVLLRAGGAGVL